MNDIYLTYWEALVDGIKDPDAKKKLQKEIADRKEGLKNDTKCTNIGGGCPWPFCKHDKRFDKGYCAP